MKNVFIGRSGLLENTTFGILSPDGKRQLATSGRGPFFAYRDATQMAAAMNRIAAQFPAANQAGLSDTQLPRMKDVDVALNVAACDNLPLVITFDADPRQLAEINRELVETAWDKNLAGQFLYASTNDAKELKPLQGTRDGSQIFVVKPGPYGLSGDVLAQFPASESATTLAASLREVVDSFPRQAKDYNSHVQLGIQLGIEWKTRIPETDLQSLRAKERARATR